MFTGAYIGTAGQNPQNSLSAALAKKHVHLELLNEASFKVCLFFFSGEKRNQILQKTSTESCFGMKALRSFDINVLAMSDNNRRGRELFNETSLPGKSQISQHSRLSQ